MCHPISHGMDTSIAAKPHKILTINRMPETQFAAAARSRWLQLGDELRADVEEFNKQGSGADLAIEGEDRYRVQNSSSGLELVLKADFEQSHRAL